MKNVPHFYTNRPTLSTKCTAYCIFRKMSGLGALPLSYSWTNVIGPKFENLTIFLVDPVIVTLIGGDCDTLCTKMH